MSNRSTPRVNGRNILSAAVFPQAMQDFMLALSNDFSTDHVHDIRFGDVNGDGRIDLIVKGYLAAKDQIPAPFIYLENTSSL